MDEINDSVCQVRREEWSVVVATVFFQLASHIHSRKSLPGRQLHVRVSLIVAQQDVEARLLLLNQVVLEGQRLFFVVYNDVLDVYSLAQKRARLGVSGRDPLDKIR